MMKKNKIILQNTEILKIQLEEKILVSLMDFHKSIKSQLRNCGYFYEIQAGSFDTKSKSKQCEYVGDSIYNNYLPDNHK